MTCYGYYIQTFLSKFSSSSIIFWENCNSIKTYSVKSLVELRKSMLYFHIFFRSTGTYFLSSRYYICWMNKFWKKINDEIFAMLILTMISQLTVHYYSVSLVILFFRNWWFLWPQLLLAQVSWIITIYWVSLWIVDLFRP